MQEQTKQNLRFWGVAAVVLVVTVFAYGAITGPKTIGEVAEQEEQRCLDRIAREGWHPGPENRSLTPEIHCALKGHLEARRVACRQWEEACR